MGFGTSHGIYEIQEGKPLTGAVEIVMSLSPFASKRFRGILRSDLCKLKSEFIIEFDESLFSFNDYKELGLEPDYSWPAPKMGPIYDQNGVLRDPNGQFAYDNSIARAKLHRPSLRSGTKATIESNTPRNIQSAFLDKSGNIIKEPQFGHIPGFENRRILAAADQLGINQNQLNNYINDRPQFFRIEEKAANLSHAEEMTGRGNLGPVLRDMRKYFGLDN